MWLCMTHIEIMSLGSLLVKPLECFVDLPFMFLLILNAAYRDGFSYSNSVQKCRSTMVAKTFHVNRNNENMTFFEVPGQKTSFSVIITKHLWTWLSGIKKKMCWHIAISDSIQSTFD